MTEPERPLRADAERNRRRLIDAAGELFAQRGLAVTLDDVAHHAGVGVGTVYRRFANRGALIEAVLDGAAEQIADLAEAALADDDPWRSFETFFLSAAEAFAGNRGLRELLLEASRDAGTLIDATQARIAPVIDRLIARAQAAGELRADIAPTDVPLVQIMIGAVVERSRGVAPDLWRRYVTVLLDGLRVRRAAPTPLGAPALTDEEFVRTLA